MDSESQKGLPCLIVLIIALQASSAGVGSGGNLALGKYATQKSTARHWNGYNYHYNHSAERAVDGLIHTNNLEEGCASTANSADMDAWWMVDLARVYVIKNITVYNRKGGYHRLRDFWIRVGNNSNITQHVNCIYKSGWIGSGASETFTCDRTLSGRWVSIQRTNDLAEDGYRNQGYLQLCEVQVYSYQNTDGGPDSRQRTTSGRGITQAIGVTPDTRRRMTWGPEITQAEVRTMTPTAITTDEGNTAGATPDTRQRTTWGPEITLTEAQGNTSDTRKSTSMRPEITQVKAACGWPSSAIITSVSLGIVVVIQAVVYIFTKVRKKYTCIRKESHGRKEKATVSSGSVAMTGLGHGDDYEHIRPDGTQIYSAGNYEQMEPVHHQSLEEEEKKYETLNSEQMTSPAPQTYESLHQP